MNQITTRYITENGACYEQYVITDPAAKTALTTYFGGDYSANSGVER